MTLQFVQGRGKQETTMKHLIRSTLINSLSLFIVSFAFSAITVKGGFSSYIIAGAILTILSVLFDPIVKILTLPFNILTMGLLSFLTTLVSLFTLTLFFQNVKVTNFIFHGFSFAGLEIREIFFSGFLSFVAISATIYFLNKLMDWLFSN